METAEVKQLKINVTNIKSSLINYNKSLISLRKSEKKLVLENVRRQKTLQKEKRIETKITPNALGTIKNTILSRPLSFFDKIKEFFGIVLLGLLINNLPQIIEKTTSAVTKLIEVSSGIINSITTTAASFKNFVTSIPENTKTKLGETKDQLTTLIDELNRMIDPLNKAYTDLEKQLPASSKSSPDKSGSTAGTSETQQKSKGGTIKPDPSATKTIRTEKVTSPFSRPGGTAKLKKARQSYNAFADFNELAKGNTENYTLLGGTSDTLAEVNNSFYNFIVELKESWKAKQPPTSMYDIGNTAPYQGPTVSAISIPSGGKVIGGAEVTQRNDPDAEQTGSDIALSGGLGAPIQNPFEALKITETGFHGSGSGITGSGYGNYVTGEAIIGGKKYELLIGHLNSISVKADQILGAGEVIGTQGITGHATGPHVTTHINQLDGGNAREVLRSVERSWVKGLIIKTDPSGGNDGRTNIKMSNISSVQKNKAMLAFDYDEEDDAETILVMGTQTIIQKEPPIIKTIMVNNNTGSQSSSSPASVSKIWTV